MENKLKAQREALGYSINYLSKISDTPRAAIVRYETYTGSIREAPYYRVEALANCLQCKISDIVQKGPTTVGKEFK